MAVVLITGTSSGIGLHAAIELARRGEESSWILAAATWASAAPRPATAEASTS